MGNPVIINPLSIVWWKGIIIATFISIIIVQFAVRIPPDKRRVLMISLGILMIAREVWKNWYISNIGAWTIEKSLPLHFCGIAAILAGIMMFKPHQKGFEFLALIGVPGSFHAFLTPQLNHGGATYQIIEYYIGHGGIILIPFYLAIVEGYRIRKSSWLNVFIMCQLLLLFIGAANYILGANYMYLTERPLANNPMIIGDWPWYILGFELVGLVHILIFYFGFRKLRPLPF